MKELLNKIHHPNDYRNRSYPGNIQAGVKPIYDDYLNDEIPVIEIRGLGKVGFSYEGVYCRNLKRLIEGSPYYFERTHPEAYKFDCETVVNKLKRLTKYLIFTRSYHCKEGLLFTDYYSYSYYHWFAEALPRLHYALLNGFRGKFFLPTIYTRFNYISESLKIFPEVDVEYIPSKSKLILENAKWVSPAGKPYQFNSSLMESYRERIHDHYEINSAISHRDRIFVNRKKASKRKLINEDEVLATFEDYGFRIVDLEDYPWADQVQLCRHVDVIAGIHGAGLTNMIFCPENVIVFELQKKVDFASCFFRISNAIGARYFTQYSIDDFDTSDSEVFSDIKINIDELKCHLDSILKKLE